MGATGEIEGEEPVLTRLLAFLGCVVVVSGCGNAQDATEPAARDTVAFDVLAQGWSSSPTGTDPFAGRDVVVLRTAAEARTFSQRLQEASVIQEPLPAVDFNKKMLAVVRTGPHPSGGYSLRATALERTSQGLVLSVTETAPGDCLSASVITYPHLVVAMEHDPADVAVRFRRTEASSC